MSFINLHKCLSEPKYFLRLIAIITCLCIACYQLSGCIKKMFFHPPISTHYTFKLNETMNYPAITVCRNPPFKSHLFEKFGCPAGGFPSQTSFWANFKYDEYTLYDFFEETTFTFKEVIPFHGFDSSPDYVYIKEFYKLRYGKCFQLTPKNYSATWNSELGFLLYLQHTEVSKQVPNDQSIDKMSTNTRSLTGFHIFIHEPYEMITEEETQRDSFMEYLYVDAGEDVIYTLRTNEYNQLYSSHNNCTDTYDYSRSRCLEMCRKHLTTLDVGCNTPWMLEESNLPTCNNYTQVKKIKQGYGSSEYHNLCQCQRNCNISIFIPYVQSRQEDRASNSSVVRIYYTSNLVTVMEEITGYDWNMFLADLGGSLGFLLGLSVLGIIGALEQILKLCFGRMEKGEINEKTEAPSIYLNGNKMGELKVEKTDLPYYLESFK